MGRRWARWRRSVGGAALGILILASVAAVMAGPQPSLGPPRRELATPVLSARRAPAVVSQPAAEAVLLERLDGILDDAPPATCLVVEVAGRRVVDHEPDLPLVPASAMKVAVATAVLERLGPEETFETVVRATEPRSGAVRSDLHLVGGGDPLLATAPYAESFTRQPQLFTPLESLADKVVAAGVERVEGAVVGDEGRYDPVRYVPSWRPLYIADNETGPMSALSVNDGFASFHGGKVPADQPALNAAAVFTELLEERGVDVAGEPAVGPAPDLPALARIESPPVEEVVGQLLRESDNQTGEMLVKELGVRHGGGGTTPIGRQVVESTLAGMDVSTDGLEVVDGSGLDRGNRLTCGTLMDLLHIDAGDGALTRGLAVVGESGTLQTRLPDTSVAGRVRAKTGSLNGVAALTGVAETRTDGEALFAFITNGIASVGHGAGLQDRLMVTLSGHPATDLDLLVPEETEER